MVFLWNRIVHAINVFSLDCKVATHLYVHYYGVHDYSYTIIDQLSKFNIVNYCTNVSRCLTELQLEVQKPITAVIQAPPVDVF